MKYSYCQDTLIPEVFLDFSSRKRSRASRDNESTKRRGEREKPLVTLVSNLTFMKTTAVKRVKLLMKRVTNGNLANTCPRAWAINQQEKTRNGNLQYGLRKTRSVRYYVSEFYRACRNEALRFSGPYSFVLRV